MSEGWLKLYRKILDWEWYLDANTTRLFLHLLLKANTEDCIWQGKNIKRGQLFTSLKSLSDQLRISPKSLRKSLDRLTKGLEIDKRGTNDGTMITVFKYEYYQDNSKTKGKQKGKQRASGGATVKEGILNNIPKEDKNWKNDFDTYLIETGKIFKELSNDNEFLKRLAITHPGIDLKKSMLKSFDSFWGTEKGWKNKKKADPEKIDWKATITATLHFNEVKE